MVGEVIALPDVKGSDDVSSKQLGGGEECNIVTKGSLGYRTYLVPDSWGGVENNRQGAGGVPKEGDNYFVGEQNKVTRDSSRIPL